MSAPASVCRAPDAVRSFSAERRSLSASAYWPSPTYVFAIVSSTSAWTAGWPENAPWTWPSACLSASTRETPRAPRCHGSAAPKVFCRNLVDRGGPHGLLLRAVAGPADLRVLDRQHDRHADQEDEDAEAHPGREAVAGDELAQLVHAVLGAWARIGWFDRYRWTSSARASALA